MSPTTLNDAASKERLGAILPLRVFRSLPDCSHHPLAARAADIVGISLLDQRGPGLPEPPSFAQKVEWVRRAAGPRHSHLELHVNVSLVTVGDVSTAAVDQMAARRGMSPEQVLESPGTLVGSVAAIAEQLLARREEYGVTYYVVPSRAMDAFAPVIARLHGG